MFNTTMYHYYSVKSDGKVVVQNMVGCYEGQTREYESMEHFKQWIKDRNIKPEFIIDADKL